MKPAKHIPLHKLLYWLHRKRFSTIPETVGVELTVPNEAMGPSAARDCMELIAKETSGLPGWSLPWRTLLEDIPRIGFSQNRVLIEGETGTGKDLVARGIANHRDASTGQDGPSGLIALNCATLPPNLADSELFGYVKGAFTGATSTRKGVFHEAEGGTLFLDEIGVLDDYLQAKLLRAVETGEVRRIGSAQTEKVSLRLIAATNAPERLRPDLRWRFEERIALPPLRAPNRRMDVFPILYYFLTLETDEESKRRYDDWAVFPTTLMSLLSSPFPGNVRELRNAARRSFARHEYEHAGDAAPPRLVTFQYSAPEKEYDEAERYAHWQRISSWLRRVPEVRRFLKVDYGKVSFEEYAHTMESSSGYQHRAGDLRLRLCDALSLLEWSCLIHKNASWVAPKDMDYRLSSGILESVTFGLPQLEAIWQLPPGKMHAYEESGRSPQAGEDIASRKVANTHPQLEEALAEMTEEQVLGTYYRTLSKKHPVQKDMADKAGISPSTASRRLRKYGS